MLYNLDGMTVEKLKSLEGFPCKGKVVFTQEGRENTTKILQMFNLFKRLESSVYAFLQTLNRQYERINNYIALLNGNGTELTDEVFSDDEETSLDYKLDIKVAHLDKEAYLNDLFFDKAIIERLIIEKLILCQL